MNLIQRVVILVGAIAIVGMTAVPPWIVQVSPTTIGGSTFPARNISAGYAPINAPPEGTPFSVPGLPEAVTPKVGAAGLRDINAYIDGDHRWRDFDDLVSQEEAAQKGAAARLPLSGRVSNGMYNARIDIERLCVQIAGVIALSFGLVVVTANRKR